MWIKGIDDLIHYEQIICAKELQLPDHPGRKKISPTFRISSVERSIIGFNIAICDFCPIAIEVQRPKFIKLLRRGILNRIGLVKREGTTFGVAERNANIGDDGVRFRVDDGQVFARHFPSVAFPTNDSNNALCGDSDLPQRKIVLDR